MDLSKEVTRLGHVISVLKQQRDAATNRLAHVRAELILSKQRKTYFKESAEYAAMVIHDHEHTIINLQEQLEALQPPAEVPQVEAAPAEEPVKAVPAMKAKKKAKK